MANAIMGPIGVNSASISSSVGPVVTMRDESKAPNPRGIYFDSKHLFETDPRYNYVCWLDVMGTGNQMLRSLPIAANFIFKLQCAVLEAAEEVSARGVRLYPVMDGVYITSERRMQLSRVLNQALCRVALTFLNEEVPFHQFLVRGAISYGPVYHGCDVEPRTSFVLARHEDVRNSMLMGLPMAQAYRAEREAPPFGLAVHSSARAFAPDGDQPFRFIWLDWFNHAEPKLNPTMMLEHLEKYFEWQLAHSTVTGYAEDRIRHHLKLAREYFTLNEREA